MWNVMLCEDCEKPWISHNLDQFPALDSTDNISMDTDGNYDVIETNGKDCPALENILRIDILE